MNISREAFLSRTLDPLRYYHFLPSDDLHIDGAIAGTSARVLGERLGSMGADSAAIAVMDELSVSLINEFDALAGDASWRPLADRMAGWYAQQLRPGGSKPIRMRAQLINFFLRDIIDAGKPTGDFKSEPLEALCPWDFMRLPDEDIWLTSDPDNVVRKRRDGTEIRLRCGLPTRMDLLGDGQIAIHSLYSNGGWLLKGSDVNEIKHDTPIVMLFHRHGRLHFVDFRTRVFDATTGEQLGGPHLEQAHFARLVGNRIFLIDCCKVGKLYELDVESLELVEYDIAPILICNDVCRASDRFYLVDKEQGSVFAFDEHFTFLEQRLVFGRAPGRLWDPAAIRSVDGRLQVLNWFASSIVTLDTF